MKICGFTYVRNGFRYGYPFLASIKSLLPLVEELIVVVGDSDDGTREAIENLSNEKIKIVDTVWDDNMRAGGKLFAQQSNIGIDHATGDWLIHLQVDEVFHESSVDKIISSIHQADKLNDVEGLLFPFYHFWGDYNHIRNTRKTHQYEIRAFRNKGCIRSYRDSQGFRKYNSLQTYEASEKGDKLHVIKTDAPVFHYSYTRNPSLMKKKANYFHRFWHDDKWLEEQTNQNKFDFNDVDELQLFTGTHPVYMKEIMSQKDWDFEYDATKSNMKFKDKILNKIEETIGYRLFEYRNYILKKK